MYFNVTKSDFSNADAESHGEEIDFLVREMYKKQKNPNASVSIVMLIISLFKTDFFEII